MCFMVEMMAINLLGQLLKYIFFCLFGHLGLFADVPEGTSFKNVVFSLLPGNITYIDI